MGNRYMKWIIGLMLLTTVITGYGGLCGKKAKDSIIATGSSATSTTLKGTVFQQTSDNNILPSGDATVTVSWAETVAGGVIGKSVARSESAKTKSDGNYEISIPKNTPVTVTITSPDTTTSTESIIAGDDAPKNSAILRGRGKKIGLIKKLQETVLNTFDDTSMPRCQITVPADAVPADVDNVYLTSTHQGENLPALPNGYIFLAGADFNAPTPIIFNPGKEATPYIILPPHIRSEELVASVNIRLMELVNGAWMITNPGGRGKVYITGEWANCIGPDIAMPAKLKGVRPWCWALIQTTTASASGTVRDSAGNPVAGAFIFGGGSTTHSQPDGVYLLRNIAVIRPNALVALNVIANGYKLGNQFVSLSPGEAKPNINFTLEAVAVAQTGEIYGKVTNVADASALYGAMVTLQTPPTIRGLRYDNKGTETDLTDDTFYVIPPSGVVITSYKWMLTLPDNSVFTSTAEASASVVLQQLAREAIASGASLTTGAYKVALEVTYTGGKKTTVAGGFLLKISAAFTVYLADVKLPLSLQDQLTLKTVTDQQGNYRFVSLPVGETFSIWAKVDGFITANPVPVAALTAGERKQQDFSLAATSTDTAAPSAPANITATASASLTGALSIFLTWSASTDNIGIDHYRVYRGGVEIGKTTLTSYIDTGITATTTYQYQVGAFDKANLSTLSGIISITTPGATVDIALPVTPTNLSAIAVNLSQINLRWQDNAVNEDGFIIERSTDGSSFSYLLAPGMLIIQVTPPPAHTPANITAYSDTIALSPATAYYYRVYARSATGYVSGYSNVISATTPATADITAPTVPTALTATTFSSGQINLAWTASTDTVGVSGYKVYRNGSYVASSLTTSYPDSGLIAGTAYSYTILAFDAAGNPSAQSSTVSATTLSFIDTTPPSQPTGLAAGVITMTYCTLTWNISTDNGTIAGYKVYRSTDNANWTLIATVNTNSWTDSGLLPATTYYYKVEAIDAAGLPSTQSAAFTATTPADDSAPTAPTGLTATAVSSAQVNLTWSTAFDMVGITGYKIYRDTVYIASVAGTSFNDMGLLPETTYNYTITAQDAAGNTSVQSSPASVTTAQSTSGTAPNAPSSLVANPASSSQINLTWTDNSNNEIGFKIERAPASGGQAGAYTQIGTLNANTISYNDTGLSASTAYYYRVRAYSSAGNSVYSNEVSATTQSPPVTVPTAPANLNATVVSSAQINLFWTDNAADETSFKLERSTDGVNWTLHATLSANTVSFNDTGLTASTAYYYRVKAYNTAGNSSASNQMTATTQPPPVTIPNAPSALGANPVSTAQIDLIWTDNASNEDGFKVERAPASGGQAGTYVQIAAVNANATFYNDTGLTPSTTYYYRIRAYNSAGNSVYSNESSTATQSPPDTPPTVPTGLNATAVSYTRIDLAWTVSTDNDYVAGYKVYRNSVYFISVTATNWSDINLAPGTANNYAVAAFDGTGNISAQSITSTATTPADTTAPTVPSGLTGTAVSTTQININWTASSDNIGVSGYKVYRDGVLRSTLYALSYSDTGLTPGTAYAYTVLAYDAANNPSAQTSAVNITTQSAGSALVAHWKFDETSGTTAGDSSGNGNNGTVYGATWSGGTLSFDGVDDYVQVPDNNSLDVANLTIEAWVIKPDYSNTWVLNKAESYGLGITGGNNNLAYKLIGYSTYYGYVTGWSGGFYDTNFPPNVWAHIAITYDGNLAKLYLNGSAITSQSPLGITPSTTGSSIVIGNLSGNYWFKGKIDDIKIYNYARTPGEIQAGYTTGRPNSWTTKASMPTARWGLRTAVVNNKIYAIGGHDGTNNVSTVEEYDPVSNIWTNKAPMPTARRDFAIGVVNNKIYCIGGWAGYGYGESLTVNEMYDPVLNTWTTKASMPTPRDGLAIGVVDNKIYAIGGLRWSTSTPMTTNEEYDPVSNTWTTKASMPTGRVGLAIGVVNNKIYAIGGSTYNNTTYFAVNEEYDPALNSWTSKANMPTARTSIAIGVVSNKIYCIGGYNGNFLATNEEYDPALNSWTSRVNMPTARYYFNIGVVSNKIYAIGGAYNGSPLSTCEEYQP